MAGLRYLKACLTSMVSCLNIPLCLQVRNISTHVCTNTCALAFLYALCCRICSNICSAFGAPAFKFKVMGAVKTGHREQKVIFFIFFLPQHLAR